MDNKGLKNARCFPRVKHYRLGLEKILSENYDTMIYNPGL